MVEHILHRTQVNIDISYRSWEAFDGNRNNSGTAWISANSVYTGTYIQTNTAQLFSTAPKGEWLKIQFPSAIVISHTDIYCRGTDTTQAPKNGFIYGSTNGTTWVQLQAFTNLTYVTNTPTRVQLNQTTTAYSYYAIVTTAISLTSSSWVGIGEWELFSPGVTLTGDLTATTVTAQKAYFGGNVGIGTTSKLHVFGGAPLRTHLATFHWTSTGTLIYHRVQSNTYKIAW
jgi:hypothetical protein